MLCYWCLYDVLFRLVYSSTLLGKKSETSLTSQPSPVKNSPAEDLSFPLSKESTLRDFLYKQIDYMMTVESREVPAEGRRGTHVEVGAFILTRAYIYFNRVINNMAGRILYLKRF